MVGDEVRVEEALQLMIQQMEKLSEASQASDPNLRLPVSLEEKIQKEEELRSTLEELQIVAEEIGEVTSDEEVQTVVGVSKLLKSVNSKIENKIQRENFRKENSNTSTAEDLNGIEEMIRSLEKVTEDLREMQSRSEFSFDYKEAETDEKESTFNDLLEAALVLQPLQNDSNSLNIPKQRRGKQLFDNDDDDDDEGKKKDQNDNVEAKTDYGKPVEAAEDCADKQTSDRVREIYLLYLQCNVGVRCGCASLCSGRPSNQCNFTPAGSPPTGSATTCKQCSRSPMFQISRTNLQAEDSLHGEERAGVQGGLCLHLQPEHPGGPGGEAGPGAAAAATQDGRHRMPAGHQSILMQ